MILKFKRFIPLALGLAFFVGLFWLLSVSQSMAQAQEDGPTITSVAPSFGWNDVETHVYIYGEGFTEPVTVTLGSTPLTLEEVLTDQMLAIVPAGMTPGLYGLTITTANGLSATKEAAYRVLEPTDVDDLTSIPEWLWTEPRTMRVGYANSGVGLNVERIGGRRLLQQYYRNGVTVEFVLKLDSGEQIVLGRSQTAPIAPNFVETTDKVIWEPEEAGEYLICATIDPDNEIPETDGEEPNGAEDNNQICRTVTVLEEPSDVVNPVVNNDFEINDGASSTSAVTVTLDVTAEDPPPNPRSGIDALYFVEYEYILRTGWVPVQRSGWIPYATAHQDYPWTLTPTYGIRYMRAWAVDKAGNISLDASTAHINLLPTEQVASVAEGEVDFYRLFVNAGQTLSVTLTPVSGDPDLYIWAPSDDAPWYSNNPIGVESMTIPIAETGSYQIEVHGYTDAEYRLSVEITDSATERLAGFRSPSKPVPTSPTVPLDDQLLLENRGGEGNKLSLSALSAIKPSFGWNDVETYLYIYGDDFVEPLTVTLHNTPLTVTEVLSDQIIALVPAGMTPGLYDLTVETAKGAATKEAAYRVLEPTDVDDMTSFREWLWSEPRTMRVGYRESALGLNVQRIGGRLFQEQHQNGVTVEFVLKSESGEDEDVVLGRSQTSPLAPTFVESTGKVIWEPEEAGQYLICAKIDPDNEIEESDESNNHICRTVTVLEQAPDLVSPTVNPDFEINDGAPSTSAATVTLDLTAEDPPPNPRSGIDALYFLEFEYIFGAGWMPVQRSDWIPYATAHQDYPWTLTPTYGIRYMRAWAVDKAGNISLDSRMADINLLPSEQIATLAEGEVDFYRILVQTGQTLSVTLTPESGDPDLYIWGAGTNPPWYSNNPLGVESLTIPMTETGTYQIEVHGYTDAQYRLNFEVTDTPSQPLRASQAGSGKPLPTAPRVPLDDIPGDNLSVDPPRPVSNTYIYLPMMTR